MHRNTYLKKGHASRKGQCAATGEIAGTIDSFEGMTRDELQAEFDRLHEQRNGFRTGLTPAEFDRYAAVKGLLVRDYWRCIDCSGEQVGAKRACDVCGGHCRNLVKGPVEF